MPEELRPIQGCSGSLKLGMHVGVYICICIYIPDYVLAVYHPTQTAENILRFFMLSSAGYQHCQHWSQEASAGGLSLVNG